MAKKLFVASLPWSFDNAKLGDLFSQTGVVVSSQVIMDRDSGRSKGFGFVEMATEEEAQNAINTLHGSDCEGRKLVVNIAKPQAPRDNSYNNRRS